MEASEGSQCCLLNKQGYSSCGSWVSPELMATGKPCVLNLFHSYYKALYIIFLSLLCVLIHNNQLIPCPGLEDRCLLRKAGDSLGMENVNSLPPNYYNFEIKGLSDKNMGIRNNSFLTREI